MSEPQASQWTDYRSTRIGERGITLSGGQRQRVCIARAAYEDTSVILLDDPLSAVDAHVGHHLLENCILSGPMAHRTRILVTHHLDVLPHADLILVMDRNDKNEGRIVQHGAYDELINEDGLFKTLIQDFGSTKTQSEPSSDGEEEAPKDKQKKDEAPRPAQKDTAATGGGAGHMTIDEERFTGRVSWSTYTRYVKSIDSWFFTLFPVVLVIANQALNVGTSVFLGVWSGQRINGFRQGQYMAVYGGKSSASHRSDAHCGPGFGAAYTVLTASPIAKFLWFKPRLMVCSGRALISSLCRVSEQDLGCSIK